MNRVLIAGLILASTLGCDDKKAGPERPAAAPGAAPQRGPEPRAEAGNAPPGAPAAPHADGEVQRKIIQTADLDVLVTDFEVARQKFARLIADHKGYVAKSDFQGSVGSKRTGTWTVRVPAESFQAFIDATAALGQPIRHATQAEDVTEEVVDTEALVKNLKEEEEAMNKLLREKAQTLVDIAAWKEKVALIRREIGRLEARLQTLGRLTALSTVHVTLRDEKEYVPPTEPAYAASVGGTFDESVQALRNFGKWLLIVLAAVAPWLAIGVPLLVLAGAARWAVRRKREAGPPALPAA